MKLGERCHADKICQTKINIHSYISFICNILLFLCASSVQCQTSFHLLSQHQNKTKMISAETTSHSSTCVCVFFVLNEMESKVRTQSPSRHCCCLNIPKSVLFKIKKKKKGLGHLENNKLKSKNCHCIGTEKLKLHFK